MVAFDRQTSAFLSTLILNIESLCSMSHRTMGWTQVMSRNKREADDRPFAWSLLCVFCTYSFPSAVCFSFLCLYVVITVICYVCPSEQLFHWALIQLIIPMLLLVLNTVNLSFFTYWYTVYMVCIWEHVCRKCMHVFVCLIRFILNVNWNYVQYRLCKHRNQDFIIIFFSHFSSILAYNRNIMVIRKVFADLYFKPAETLFIAVTYAETLFVWFRYKKLTKMNLAALHFLCNCWRQKMHLL